MEYRKLISFGKSSHVISLPKDWLVKNSIKKGDSISLSVNNENLVLRSKSSKSEEESQESKIVINVDDKTIQHVKTEIVSAYINNYRTIILEGRELKNKAKSVQDAIQDLIALEMMEQDSERIVAKDFLNMKDISIKNLIEKMDLIVRAMIADAKITFDEDNYENIRQRDRDLNRLFFLSCRAIKYGLRNPLAVSQLFKIESGEELLNLRLASTYLEKIGDTAKRAAKFMRLVKFNERQKNDFIKIFNKIEQQFLQMIDAYYKKDRDKALRLYSSKEEIIKQCDDFYLKNKSVEWLSFLITQLQNMLVRVYSIGRVIYQ